MSSHGGHRSHGGELSWNQAVKIRVERRSFSMPCRIRWLGLRNANPLADDYSVENHYLVVQEERPRLAGVGESVQIMMRIVQISPDARKKFPKLRRVLFNKP
jgi:hypothetical protein